MLDFRMIPCLLLSNEGLVKTIQFDDPKYVGDPINVVRIFNDKFVDELAILDIRASKDQSGPNFNLLDRIAKEAFMPMGYGGGISNLESISKLFRMGYEKVIINSQALRNPGLISDAAEKFGSQSIVVCMDVTKNFWGNYCVYDHVKGKKTKESPLEYAQKMEKMGAGELLLYSVDNDGIMEGYDLELIKLISDGVNIPVIALGGAGNNKHLAEAIKLGKASAVGAGSFFIFKMPHRAVLISYPDRDEIMDYMTRIAEK